jgi:hypothetical protein
MSETTLDPAQLAAYLRAFGLIPADYTGEVVVSSTTSEGSDSVTISV